MTDPKQTECSDDDRTAVASDTWLSVVRAYNECTATLSQKLAPFGISLLEHEILMNLLISPGLKQRQLSERCFSAKSGISMIVSQFEKDDIVQRTRSKKDARAWMLSLTDKGQKLAVRLSEVQTEVVLAMASPYTTQELSRMKDRMDQSSVLMQKIRADDGTQ